MKKVGILTFHKAHNYGALLQAFALQETIKSLNYNVEIVDYCPKSFNGANTVFKSKIFKERSLAGKVIHILEFIILIKSRIKRYNAFENFINNKLKLSQIKSKNDNFDE